MRLSVYHKYVSFHISMGSETHHLESDVIEGQGVIDDSMKEIIEKYGDGVVKTVVLLVGT